MKNIWNEIKKPILFVIIVILIVVVGVIIFNYEKRINTLETELAEMTYEVDQLDVCPLCGKEVALKQSNDSYYIVCEKFVDFEIIGCGLETGYYKSKKELVEKWNGMLD